MEYLDGSGVERKYLTACCCCLKDGCVIDISDENYSSGQKEVYREMLQDTFNIQIDNYISIPQKQMICEQCVHRVRDAAVFRQMVINSQEIVRDYWQRASDPETDVLQEIVTIKVEAVESIADDEMVFGDEAAADFSDDEVLANLKEELLNDVLNRSTDGDDDDDEVKNDQKRQSKRKKCKVKDNTDDETPVDPVAKDWRKIVQRRGPGPALRDDSLKLLEHSTGCVFQWNKSIFRCFCCKDGFFDLESLRDHTDNEHTLEDIERKIISQQNRLVKVEITVLNCKLCSQKIEDLKTLRTHLTDEHSIKFVFTEDLLVPFKINDNLQCQICFEKFEMFRLLNIHMNKHYPMHVCHICGSSFSNSVFLNLHKTRSHTPFQCKQCNMLFTNKAYKKAHDISVHGVKTERKLRFPCPYCSQRFYQENFRVQHLVEKHGMTKPQYKCDVCTKVFITRSLCNNHVKTVHKKEKKQECDVCHKLFYNKSDVLRHRVTHTGEKKFSCNVCNSPFATKDSLRRHVRRSHVGLQ